MIILNPFWHFETKFLCVFGVPPQPPQNSIIQFRFVRNISQKESVSLMLLKLIYIYIVWFWLFCGIVLAFLGAYFQPTCFSFSSAMSHNGIIQEVHTWHSLKCHFTFITIWMSSLDVLTMQLRQCLAVKLDDMHLHFTMIKLITM